MGSLRLTLAAIKCIHYYMRW